MQPRVNAIPEGHWFCGNCGGNATCYRGPTTGGINVGLPAWPQAVEIHLCNHLAVDNQLFQYSSPYNNEKPWKYLPRNKQKGRFSVNTDHYLFNTWSGIVNRCTDPKHTYFAAGTRIDPAWRGVSGIGSGFNRTDKYAFLSFVFY